MAGLFLPIKNQNGVAICTALMMLAGLTAGLRAETSLQADIIWSFRLVSPGLLYNASRSTPAIADDGTIYTGTFGGTFFAITADGKEKWRFKAGREIKSSPAIADDGTIYFGSRDRKFYALTPLGKLKWVVSTGGWVDSSPAIAADGTVYFGGWDKNFYALNPDGSQKWKFDADAIIDSSPAIAANGTVYFGAHDKKFYALNPDGTVRWTFLTGGNIISSPALDKSQTIYFTSLDGNLYALKPDGTEKWRYHSGSATESSPVLNSAGDICIGSTNYTLAISAEGRWLWSWGSAVPLEASPAAVAGNFYFSRPWRQLLGRSSAGKQMWQVDLPGNISTSIMVGTNGLIYACAETELYALRPPGEALPQVNGPWPMFHANTRHTGRVNDPDKLAGPDANPPAQSSAQIK